MRAENRPRRFLPALQGGGARMTTSRLRPPPARFDRLGADCDLIHLTMPADTMIGLSSR